MNKTMIKAALLASLVAFGGCSTYNSLHRIGQKSDHLALRLKQAVTPLKMNPNGGTHFLGRLDLAAIAATDQRPNPILLPIFWQHFQVQSWLHHRQNAPLL